MNKRLTTNDQRLIFFIALIFSALCVCADDSIKVSRADFQALIERVERLEQKAEHPNELGYVDATTGASKRVQSTEDRVQTELAWIQNKLFNLGAELSEAPGEWITDADVHQLETWIDAMQAEVPKQHAFVLPAGSESVTRCHVCRTVCRRAERRMIESQAFPVSMQFINRLSDYLFVLSRYIAFTHNEPEEVWKK